MPMMEQIAEKHKTLIHGLTKLYDILIAMHYISASNVLRPPHANQTVAIDTLHRVGFESEVIDLVKLLPALRSGVTWGYQSQGTELAPRSKAASYFADCEDPDFLEDLRHGDFLKGPGMKLLPPWMLRITTGGQDEYGVHLIYNTQDQTITEWTHIELKYWDEIPSRPSEAVLTEMVQKFRSLDWVPYYDPDDSDEPPSRVIVENPVVFQNIWPGGIRIEPINDPMIALETVKNSNQEDWVSLKTQVNRWYALQKLYRDYGWNSGSLDRDAFERKRAEWIKEANELQHAQYRVLAPWETHSDHEQQILRQNFAQKWEAFWRERAGVHAI